MSRHHRRAPPRPRAHRNEASARPVRLAAIDALRGIALCLMIVYHFCFDLVWFKVFAADFNNDPFWLGFRALVLSWFLLLVGASLVLAERARQSPRRFWRRIGLIVSCAVLVSAASYVMFPRTFITFGVLHCIAVASILGRPLVRFPAAALVLGLAVIAAGLALGFPLFDAPWLNWVGMMTHKPATEDYVPLFPWLGVVLVGIPLGGWIAAHERPLLVSLNRMTPAWLAFLGRHSLLVYMVHQPVLAGILRVVL